MPTRVVFSSAVAAIAAVASIACASAGSPAAQAVARRAPCALRNQDSVFLAAGPVYRDCSVDKAAVQTSTDVHPNAFTVYTTPRPCYSAELEFVVSADGQPELETTRLLSTNDAQFADAVREIVPRLHYEPAMVGGRAVRQIVSVKQVAMTRLVAMGAGAPPSPRRSEPPSSC